MYFFKQHAGIYTDLYELTMAQGYFVNGRKDAPACFDYFFRNCPFGGGYVLMAGLADLLEFLQELKFDDDDLNYLRSLGFKKEFLKYLANFRFRADIHSVREGEVIFPNEPVIRVCGNIIESQLIETLLLNIINFESLIATKTSRICRSAGSRIIVDFGLRRAQGLGGIHASRAAIIGGAKATSNVYSAFYYDLKTSGTQAHSWVQSFDDELTAFRDFAKVYPDNCILLVDTYDTLNEGIPNAIKVGREMEKRGHKLYGVRLDSGDLAYLSKKARKMLDDAGLHYVKIVASNLLDEYVIRSLLEQQAPIDAFGVGTKLVTGQPDAALDGIYKLCMSDNKPRMKLSESMEKQTLPGIKKVLRYSNGEGMFMADGILLETEKKADVIFHPHQPQKHTRVKNFSAEPLFQKVMEKGKITVKIQPPAVIAEYARKRLNMLPQEHQRFENPHTYKVGISDRLMNLRKTIMNNILKKFSKTKKARV
ncbi:MAG TPA: nicotinate phosphoribosyltransferase [Chitinophagales bacterium]|nr:nicotinate phosphoribosyltransferase [Chitinophagales bacterium]